MEPRVTLTIDCVDPDSLARFWSEVLGYSDLGQPGEFRPLVPANEREPVIVLQRVSEAKTGKNRMHLDIHVEDLEVEVGRLRSLGARKFRDEHYEGRGHTWYVMADPEGNEFCVVADLRRNAPAARQNCRSVATNRTAVSGVMRDLVVRPLRPGSARPRRP